MTASPSDAARTPPGDAAVALRCRCGTVRGRLARASRAWTNRAVCYCDDCQAFAHRLGRADLLDARGGTDIVQVPPASLAFEAGQDRIAGLRLSPRGLFRWHARCCGTPLGNTAGPALPFVGLPAAVFAVDGQSPDRLFGAPIGAIHGECAVGGAPPGSKGIALPLMARTMWKVLRWRLSGRTWPHPFYDRATGEPTHPVTVLSREERDALRPLCGPRPTARPPGT